MQLLLNRQNTITMNSRFKFVQSVNPQPIPVNAAKPKFSKLTLATSKFVTVEKESRAQMTTTVVQTTTSSTITKVVNDEPKELDTEELSCAQQPKMLMYESTKDDAQSDLLTDDDTNSLGSIDSNELPGRKQISQQSTQDNTGVNIDQIDTQLQNLSFVSPSVSRRDVNDDEHLQNMSRRLDKLDIDDDNQQEDMPKQSLKLETNRLSVVSIQTLSSTDIPDNDQNQSVATQNEQNNSDVVIVLTDSEGDKDDGRNCREPPLKPKCPSINDGAMYNISPIDTLSMQQVNQFFDNAPFTEVVEVDQSFNASRLSNKTDKDDDECVPETTYEESIENKSIVDSNSSDVAVDQPKASEAIFSDNNIVMDIPVIKSTSDQPRQLIGSISGVRLTASHSSPLIKASTGATESECIKTSGSNVIVNTPTNAIRYNSSNGQLNIAAKININIQIVQESSEESCEENPRKSQAIRSSNEYENQSDIDDTQHANQSDSSSGGYLKVPLTRSPNTPRNRQTPAKNGKMKAINTPTRTPSTGSKIKQFEFVPPKSMTKAKKTDTNLDTETINSNNEAKSTNRSPISDNLDDENGFKVDTSIPISPRDQKLLHKVYGEAWKTPEVVQSYSAVKGKSVDRAAVNTTPSVFKPVRYSKGFDLFKQKMKMNLNSTRMEDFAEISIIETPKVMEKNKTPEKLPKSKHNTPRSKKKPSSTVKKVFEQSPSVLTKKKPSPKSNKKNLVTSGARAAIDDSSILSSRPKRNARKLVIVDSDDDSDKENGSDWSDDTSYSDSDLLTDDNSDEETTSKPRSVRGAKQTSRKAQKKSAKDTSKNDFVFLDLSSEEVVQVDEHFHSNISEEDLANITRKFLETDLNDEEKPKKKTGRKLFTQKIDDDLENETIFDTEPKSVKKKPDDEPNLSIEIPRFTHKLFDSKKFGSPSVNKTPIVKPYSGNDGFKTPSTPKVFSERKTPFGSGRSKLDSPPRMFEKYGFLRSLDVQASMMLCHPDAKKFRDNFKSHKEELTTILYKMYNEGVFSSKLDVDIVWNKKLTTTAGRFHGRSKTTKNGKNHRIELSEKVLTSADRLRCTLIHEMCHAATWIFHNEKGHGMRWKSWAKKANHIFPELPVITVCHSYDIEYKYTYKCDMCHSKSQSHSKSKKVENIRCSFCHGMISIFLNKKKGGQVVLEPVREATGFAKFVKEKYKDFKKPGVTHADVMRQISNEYSALSQEEKKKY